MAVSSPIYTPVNAAIIERCKQGERKAFHELYDLYAKSMYNISRRILNNSAEAEEVLQDSFVKVFGKIGSYDPRHSFGAWLKRIVINASLDTLKKRKPVFVALDSIQYAAEEAAETWDDEDDLDHDVETIQRSVGELPDGYRTILTLFLFEDCSHKEIASLLGISEGTSKSQYSRAKKKLVELIKQKTLKNER
jgi:RNA polymerase sigma factor (sigma-70 family)